MYPKSKTNVPSPLHKGGSHFITPQGETISIIQASICLAQNLQSKSPTLTKEELLSQAYTSNLLDLSQAYLTYSCYQDLTQEYLSFFTPITHQNPCTLDILLPLCLDSVMACIFLSSEKSYFCFYQNSQLVFCREFIDDLKTYIQQVQIFFSYQIDELYCLSYDSVLLDKLMAIYPLTPLLQRFDKTLDFEFSSISHAITLNHFINLNPQDPTKPSQTKKITLALGIPLLLLILSAIGIYLYHTHLLSTLKTLNQTPQTNALSLSQQELDSLESQNKALLSSIYEFSLLEKQELLILSRIISHLNPQDILSIKFDSTLTLHLKSSPDLAPLLSLSSSLGYRCRTYKEGDDTILEITRL